jgi:HlyD family secretion protein
MKKISLISATILIILFAGWFFLEGNEINEDKLDDYSTIRVEKRNIEEFVTATGIIKPKIGAEVRVGAQVSGIVKRLFVEIGSVVKKGDPLAEIESSGYKAKVALSEAQKLTAETDKKFAGIELKRYTELIQSGGVSQQQLETIQKSYELASARLMQTIADLDYALLQLGYTKILSPIDGVVSSVATQEGETVTANFASPTFLTIIDLNRLEVWAYVDETDIGRIEIGQEVKFSVDTYPGTEFTGNVQSIYPRAEIQNDVVNYITVINVNKHEGKILRPEMTAATRIIFSKKENLLTVPKNSTKNENGKSFIYLSNNGRLEKRFIEIGISDKKHCEVISGLKVGDRVITSEIKTEN